MKPFICPNSKCGRNYKFEDSLKRHLQFECGVEPQFKCSYCPSAFKRPDALKRHTQRKHSDGSVVEEVNVDNDKGIFYILISQLSAFHRYFVLRQLFCIFFLADIRNNGRGSEPRRSIRSTKSRHNS